MSPGRRHKEPLTQNQQSGQGSPYPPPDTPPKIARVQEAEGRRTFGKGHGGTARGGNLCAEARACGHQDVTRAPGDGVDLNNPQEADCSIYKSKIIFTSRPAREGPSGGANPPAGAVDQCVHRVAAERAPRNLPRPPRLNSNKCEGAPLKSPDTTKVPRVMEREGGARWIPQDHVHHLHFYLIYMQTRTHKSR